MSFNECKILLRNFSLSQKASVNFFDYVHGKIAKDTKNRFVDKNRDSIDIITPENGLIKVIPIYKDIDSTKLSLEKEVAKAVKIITTTDFKSVYFVYPKNDNFTKHIQIKVPLLEEACGQYLIKIIPYSLTTIQRRCNGNSTILCK
jgi:hypothetical protein